MLWPGSSEIVCVNWPLISGSTVSLSTVRRASTRVLPRIMNEGSLTTTVSDVGVSKVRSKDPDVVFGVDDVVGRGILPV